MSDDQDQMAKFLEHFLQNYEGDEDDPKWKQAQQFLANMKPKPMFLHCPKCGFLHVDEGEWATKPHRKHQCVKCRHEWKPHAYPTVGISIKGMDATESMAFLRYYGQWVNRARQANPRITPRQLDELRGVLTSGWLAARDYWMNKDPGSRPAAPKKTKAKGAAKRKAAPEPEPEDDDIPEPDPQIAQALKEGKLDRDDIEGLGLDPRSYGLPTEDEVEELDLVDLASAEDNADLAGELGIEFDDGGEYDDETGISF